MEVLCVPSKLCVLSPLHLLFQQQDWVHLLTLHHMMEVVRVPVSVLEGQFPDQDRLPIWTIIWENKIFCYDIAFLQRFTSPDQMVETKQPQAYIFFGFWNHLGKWNRHTESKRHSNRSKKTQEEWNEFISRISSSEVFALRKISSYVYSNIG